MTTQDFMILPRNTMHTKPYWEGTARGQLLLQRCMDCGAYRHPPTPMCARCTSFQTEWVPAKGTGKVFTYTIAHHVVHPALADRVPYNIVVVELDEGVQVISNIVDCSNEDVRV